MTKLLAVALFTLSACGMHPCSKNVVHFGGMTMSAKSASNVAHYQFEGEVSEDSVKPAIEAIENAEDAGEKAIVIEINSPGGSVPAGFDLARVIENSKIPVVCVVDGQADSMAFYLLQSCSVRYMTKRSMLMAHQPSLGGMFQGQPNEWQSIADMMKAMADAMAEHCAHRLKVSVDEYKHRTDGGRMWWFSQADGLKFGAVDDVVGSVDQVLKLYK